MISSLNALHLLTRAPGHDTYGWHLSRPRLAVTGKGPRWVLVGAILISSAVFVVRPEPTSAPSAALQSAVNRTLGQDGQASTGRLISANVSDSGDFEIEFVLQERGDADANRAAALADALAITRAVYQTPRAGVANVTLLGVWRPESTARPMPVLYASFPADRMAGLDWTRVEAGELSTFGVVRWLPGGLCQAWHVCGAAPQSM